MTGRARTLSVLVLCMLCIPAIGESLQSSSIEWLVDSSPHIGVFEVTEAKRSATRPHSVSYEVTAKLTTRKKGAPPQTVRFPYTARRRTEDGIPEVRNGHEFLVFFVEGRDAKPVVKDSVSLSDPNTRGARSVVLTSSFAVLRTKAKILSAVADRVKLKRNVAIKGMKWDRQFMISAGRCVGIVAVPPLDSEAWHALRSLSVGLLLIPADEEFQRQCMKGIRSDNVGTRASAAQWLAAFPGKETEKALRSLLDDPWKQTVTVGKEGGETERVPCFDVRYAALDSLRRIGVAIEAPSWFDKRVRYHFRRQLW